MTTSPATAAASPAVTTSDAGAANIPTTALPDTSAAAVATGTSTSSNSSSSSSSAPAPSTAAAAAAPVATPSWRDSLPERFRTNPKFQNFQSQEDLLNSYDHAASMVGRDPSTIAKKPGLNATSEEWRAYYEFNGTPKTDGDYKAPDLTKDAALKDVKLSSDELKAFQKEAWEAGLNQEQFERVIRADAKLKLDASARARQEFITKSQAGVAEIKAEWGLAFPEKSDAINNVINIAGTPELKKLLNDSGLGANKDFLRMMDKLCTGIQNDKAFEGARPSSSAQLLSPADALGKINGRFSDPAFMQKFHGENHPDHKAAVAEMQNLYEFAYPNQRA